MYTNVSAEFLTALQRPSRHFAARFKDNGTVVDLEVKNIKAHFGSCGAGSLAVGCAFSSYIEVTANRTDILLEGKELFLEIGLLLPDDSYEYVPFGYWTVQKPTKTKDSMSFQAVDRMNGSFNAEYETELTYPATVAAVLSEFTTKTGITVHCSLQTSTVMIAAPIVGTQRNALSIIAATLLGNAWIDRNGEIQITTIGGGTVVEVNYDYVKTQPEMDEEPTVIEGVKVYTVEGQTDTWIERGTGNQVTVSDVYMTDANLDIVKNNVMGLTYGGGTVSFMGNPLLDPSDIIKFRGGIEMEEYMLVTETNANIVSDGGDELAALAYESYEVPCMDIVQDFDGGLLTTVTATGQFEDTENTIAPAPMASELARQASAINSAQQTADNAVVLANGKNKIFYQDAEPTTGMSVGDMWFDTDGGNAIYEYKSTGWVLRQLGQGSLAANSVTAVEINVATLSAIAANIGTVTAGVLRSSDYSYSSGTYTTAGMIIDLNNKVIRTPKTAILADGSLYATNGNFSGTISAATGNIGGWIIDGATNRIYSRVTIGTKTSRANMQSMGTETDPARLAFYVAIDENGSSTYPFRVNYAGTLFTSDVQATGGKIGPWTIGSTAIYNTLTSMADSAHDGTYIGTDGIRMVSGGQTVSNSLVANSTWSYVESANDVVGIRMVAWPDGSTGLYEYDVIGGTLSTLWLRSGNSLSTDYNVWVGSDVDSYVNILKNGTIALSKTNGGGRIEFCYAGTIPATSYLYEESSNHLYTNAYLRTKLYNGTIGQVVGSVPTDGNQIAYFSSNATTLFINGQHGTTGSTFANKNIAFSTSDIRLKTNIEDAGIEALPIVNRMKVRAFDWTDGRKDIHQSIGVIADELEKIDRRLSVGGGYAEDGSINYKSVDTLYLCGYLLKAIQELSAEVKALKGVA